MESRTSKWAWHYFQEKLIKIILPLLFQSQHNGINLVLSEKRKKKKSLGVRICERETSPHKSNDNGDQATIKMGAQRHSSPFFYYLFIYYSLLFFYGETMISNL